MTTLIARQRVDQGFESIFRIREKGLDRIASPTRATFLQIIGIIPLTLCRRLTYRQMK